MATSHALDRLDRSDLSSLRVAQALKRWQQIVALPQSRLDADHSDYTSIDAPMIRRELEQALHALPARHAAPLRRLVADADHVFAAKTTHNPYADPAQPWWARRWHH